VHEKTFLAFFLVEHHVIREKGSIGKDQAVNFLRTDVPSSHYKAGLSWIAEEIETTIHNGHSVTRTPEVSDYDEHKIIPFDKDEQLRITLRTIQRYMVELHKAWFWARDDLRETLENPNLQISIAYLGSDEPLHLFNHDFETHLIKLDELLRRAWPSGTEPYDLTE